MPHSIPTEKIISVAVRYLSHRQLQGRTTTLRDFARRMGLGQWYLTRKFDAADVDYQLAAYAREILLLNIPDELAEELEIDNRQLYESYLKLYKEPTEEKVSPLFDPDSGPYGPYRISDAEYKELKEGLITWEELVKTAKLRGYSRLAIYRAVGGPYLRYGLAGPLWRPFVLGKKKYYAKEVLRYLSQSDKTYKKPSTAELKRIQRQQKPEAVQ